MASVKFKFEVGQSVRVKKGLFKGEVTTITKREIDEIRRHKFPIYHTEINKWPYLEGELEDATQGRE